MTNELIAGANGQEMGLVRRSQKGRPAGPAFRLDPGQIGAIDKLFKRHAGITVRTIVVDSLHEADAQRLNVGSAWKRLHIAERVGLPAEFDRSILLPNGFAVTNEPGTMVFKQLPF